MEKCALAQLWKYFYVLAGTSPGNAAVLRNKFISYVQAISLQVRTRLKLRIRVKASTNPLP